MSSKRKLGKQVEALVGQIGELRREVSVLARSFSVLLDQTPGNEMSKLVRDLRESVTAAMRLEETRQGGAHQELRALCSCMVSLRDRYRFLPEPAKTAINEAFSNDKLHLDGLDAWISHLMRPFWG